MSNDRNSMRLRCDTRLVLPQHCFQCGENDYSIVHILCLFLKEVDYLYKS